MKAIAPSSEAPALPAEPPGESSPFFQTGGTLTVVAPSYVPRQADHDVYEALRRGEFCFVLTSRQMGKSSLKVRCARRLHEEGIRVAVLDLTTVGGKDDVSVEQWYNGLLTHIGLQFALLDKLEVFWEEHQHLGPMQRWMSALREVVLPSCPQGLVVFIDEIDVVRSLPFSTDGFFAGIRACYDNRPQDPELKRLTFCLLGVATPSDLVRDVRLTPFNVGRRIELNDFTRREADVLAAGLCGPIHQPARAARLLDRIFYWTAGHPYLTQRLCQAVAEHAGADSPRDVDRVCSETFLSPKARETDHNLQFVRSRVLYTGVDTAALLDLYRRIRRGLAIANFNTNPLVSVLKLAGLVHEVDGRLLVRNRVYRRVFDRPWIADNMPDREKRLQRQAFRRGMWRAGLVATAVIGVILGGIGLYWDAYVREHVGYFSRFVKRRGIVEGVFPLSDDQVRHRTRSYRITRIGRRQPAHRLEAIDMDKELTALSSVGTYLLSAGNSSNASNQNQDCRREYITDAEGRVVYEKAYNKQGELVWGFVYSPHAENATKARGHYVDKHGFPGPREDSDAEYVEIEYSPAGFEQTLRFLDRQGQPQRGKDGAYAQWREFDARGLGIELMSLDRDGKPMIDQFKNCGVITTYDDLGNDIESRSIGTDGEPIATRELWTILRSRYDSYGNLVEEAYFDQQGNKIASDSGYTKLQWVYDDHCHKSEVRWHYELDPPSMVRRIEVGKFDSSANIVEFQYCDADGKRVTDADGSYSTSVRNDDRGNRIELAYFDEQGKMHSVGEGYTRLQWKYDDRNRKIEKTYLYELKPHPDGYHSLVLKLDAEGRTTDAAFFDAASNPMQVPRGYHRFSARYDDRGDRVEEAYFDEHRKPVAVGDGLNRIQWTYDGEHRKLEEIYFYELKPHADGFQRSVSKLDEQRRAKEIAFFDSEGKPVRSSRGYHGLKSRYDDRGNRIEVAYFDEQHQPIAIGDGYTKLQWVYDEQKHKIEETAWYELQANAAGHRCEVDKLDEQGHITEVAYFDLGRKPMSNSRGFHGFTTKYDDHGNEAELAYFDEHRKPVAIREGYAVLQNDRDAENKLRRRRYFDVKGKPLTPEVSVAKIQPGSAADAFGIREGDIFVKFDGVPITDAASFIYARQGDMASAKPLLVKRGDKELTFTASGRNFIGLIFNDHCPSVPSGNEPNKPQKVSGI